MNAPKCKQITPRITKYAVTPYLLNSRGLLERQSWHLVEVVDLPTAKALAAKWLEKDDFGLQPFDKVTITAVRELEVWK